MCHLGLFSQNENYRLRTALYWCALCIFISREDKGSLVVHICNGSISVIYD